MRVCQWFALKDVFYPTHPYAFRGERAWQYHRGAKPIWRRSIFCCFFTGALRFFDSLPSMTLSCPHDNALSLSFRLQIAEIKSFLLKHLFLHHKACFEAKIQNSCLEFSYTYPCIRAYWRNSITQLTLICTKQHGIHRRRTKSSTQVLVWWYVVSLDLHCTHNVGPLMQENYAES